MIKQHGQRKKKKQKVKPIEGAFNPTNSVQLVSKEEALRLAKEADIKMWSMLNTFDSLACVLMLYGDSIVSTINQFGYKQEHYQSVKRWANHVNKSICTFETFLTPFYKDPALQMNTIGNTAIMIGKAVQTISSVTPSGAFISEEDWNYDLALIPKNLKAAIDASPILKDGIKYFSDMVNEGIEENEKIMDRKGIDKTNNVEIIFKSKAK